MKLPKKASVLIIVLAIGIIGGASWYLLSGAGPLKQQIAEKVTEKIVDTAVDTAVEKVVDKAKEELQEKVIDKIFE